MTAGVVSMGMTEASLARAAALKPKNGIFTGLFSANKKANDSLQAQYVKPSGNAKIDAVIKVYYDALDTATMIPPSPAGQPSRNLLDVVEATSPSLQHITFY